MRRSVGSLVGSLISASAPFVLVQTATGQSPAWQKLCQAGSNPAVPLTGDAETCRGQALAAGQGTYRLVCQMQTLVMGTTPLQSAAAAPAVESTLWTASPANAGLFVDEYLNCARAWDATR